MRSRRAVLFIERTEPETIGLIRKPFRGDGKTTPEESQAIADWVTATIMRGTPLLDRDEGREPPPRLSPRYRQILRLMAEGKDRYQIARALGIQPMTVASYQKRIYRILGCDGENAGTQAVARWLRFQGT